MNAMMRASTRTSLSLLLTFSPLLGCTDDVPGGGPLDDDGDGTSTSGSPTTDPTTDPSTDPTVDPGTTSTEGTTTDPTVDPDSSGGPECAEPQDCAALATECSEATCEGGRCVVTDLAEGTPCGDASSSECDGADACDGAGSCLPNTAGDGAACTACDGLECACAAGACSACAAFAPDNDFSTDRSVVGWELTGDWKLYTEAPSAYFNDAKPKFGLGGGMLLPGIPFGGQVLGTDGNRSAPYPGGHAEISYARTKPFVLPASLDFRSWHLDEGGETYDNKTVRVSVDGGKTFTELHDCQSKASAGSPMCAFLTQRAGDDWDDISLTVPAELVGQVGIVEFGYDTDDGCCDFERGWFIDMTSFATECACGDDSVCAEFGTECGEGLCGAGACALDPIGEGMACGSNEATSCGSADSCDAAGYCRANDLVNLLSCEDCPAGAENCNGCLDGACSDCPSPTDSFDAGISEWTRQAASGGNWSAFSEIPNNEDDEGVISPLDTAFMGNDGSTVGEPDGIGEVVDASVTSPVDVMPNMLTFDSWNLDEGGLEEVDDKRIEVSVDGGETWTTLADCSGGVGSFPFCERVEVRGADEWDAITIDTSAFAGMEAQLRFTYLTGDSCCDFEYGWYIDNLNFAQICPDPNPAEGEGEGEK